MPTNAAQFHQEATEEYDAAFDWYLERSPNAALRFDEEVDFALAQIGATPTRWAGGPALNSQILLRQFPFTLIYRERAPNIQIIAVAHTSRKPGYWKQRL
jgi:plasmid stabilization system protein ParE